ncbi:alpha/beta fold hydrolase [Streptococcus massiliensis]|uniref:2-hydroxy-6-oxo-6-phenylhexa-2,4-dienoate hydrolase n=1 Tax=Streptococcus massiliensis TaxID=313439 RepID=A0A380L0Z1_9STRE|nr:alpha/beta hydrolase [Streptococcus massiliensis]SUN77546.1 2-hydroxy-6-oxo-6-phenylhexa-2,4-dienoate hydrolase [Streptococcus massiliensis]
MMKPEFIDKLQSQYALSLDVDEKIKEIGYDKPSLFLAGRQDQVVGFEQLAALLRNYPRASLAVLDIAGHNLQIDQEDLFATLAEEWLERVFEND